MTDPSPAVSVVVAVLNEADNVEAVAAEVFAAFDAGPAIELVFVDDGSDDDTARRIAALRRRDPRVRLMRHDRRCGQSIAVRTGVLAARAPWIATLDGDGQNDPADLPAMLAAAIAGAAPTAPLIAGVRLHRNDPRSRVIATRIANGLRQAVLGDHSPDTACGVKVFARADFLLLPAFDGMHRYLPALFQSYGHALINMPVRHRARLRGRSKYTNWGRALVGMIDILGVLWLIRRTPAPTRVVEG